MYERKMKKEERKGTQEVSTVVEGKKWSFFIYCLHFLLLLLDFAFCFCLLRKERLRLKKKITKIDKRGSIRWLSATALRPCSRSTRTAAFSCNGLLLSQNNMKSMKNFLFTRQVDFASYCPYFVVVHSKILAGRIF